jgi:methyl-accepting chemotaxis protein
MAQMTMGRKMTWAGGALVALVVALGWGTLSWVGRMNDALNESGSQTTKKLSILNEMSRAAGNMMAAQRGLLLYTYAKDPAGVQAQGKLLFRESAEKMARSTAALRPLLVTEEGRRLADRVDAAVANWSAAFSEMERPADQGNAEEALKVGKDRGLAARSETDSAIARLIDLQAGLVKSAQASAAGMYSTGRLIVLMLTGIALGVGGLLLFVVRQNNEALRQVSRQMSEGAKQVAGASVQVSASSQALAQGASEQAASVEQTSASSEEITSITAKNAENARAAAELAVEAARRVEQANRTLEEMVASMHEINASSDKISRIIKVIDEIAFQTNILALNAAVEAARAGEAGMGFAVVADEVRTLAQRSAQAAKDTAALIEESITKSNEGGMKLDQVASAIRGITDNTSKVKTLVEEVKLSSEEQARGIEQISTAIAQMGQVTQKAAASAEESAAAGQQMSAQAEALQATVHRLETLIDGDEDATGRLAARRASPALAARGAKRKTSSPPARPGGLKALATAVSRDRGGAPQPRAMAATAKSSAAIPLDDDFREF